MADTITIHKLNDRGEETWRYTGRVIRRGKDEITLEAFFDRDEVSLRGLTLRTGDRFVETFYANRWYNIFAIHDVDDQRLKGWYCNIARPARFSQDGRHIHCEDLAIDLIVSPDGRWRVLDEEEYAALDLSLDERKQALRALAELQSLVLRGEGAFQVLQAKPGAVGQ